MQKVGMTGLIVARTDWLRERPSSMMAGIVVVLSWFDLSTDRSFA